MVNQKDETVEFDLDAVFDVEDYLYFYEPSLTPERTEAEVQFVLRELGLQADMRILDLACGHGRHANPLAERGYHVTGVDRSAGFLDIARSEATQKGLAVEYIQQDMRQISFENQFDRVMLMYTAFGYFDDDENLRVLHNIAKALKTDGLFLFDLPNRDTMLRGFRPYGVTERGQDLMIDRCTFDALTGRQINKRIMIRNGKRKDATIVLRLYNPNEIDSLLGMAGLKIHQMFGNWESEPFDDKSFRMIIIAKKGV